MGKIEEIIKKLCPNGVKYQTIKEVFYNYSGMTGVSNKWKDTGNCQFIDYMNVYKNLKVNVNLLPFASVKKIEQNSLKKGDILLTCASETPDECAISAVIEDDIVDGIFLDDHLFGLRLKEKYVEKINTTFINYYMHTNKFRKEVNKAVRGVTRFYIAVDNFMNICIPVPPLEVQCEIVHVLDDFTLLSAELSAELKARQKQYEYYATKLFKQTNSEECLLENLATFSYGYTDKAKDTGNARFVRITDINEQGYLKNEEIKYITLNTDAEKNLLKKGDLVMARTGATYGKTLYFDSDFPSVYASFLIKIMPDNTRLLNKYYWHYTKTPLYWEQAKKLVTTGGQPQFNTPAVKKIKIPLPPIEEQVKIIDTLDRLDKLCNDISEGLPAEIEARQKQYEYYKEKLLNFKELKVEE